MKGFMQKMILELCLKVRWEVEVRKDGTAG